MAGIKLRLDRYKLLEIFAPVAGFLASIVVLLIIVIVVGESPGEALTAIYKFSLSSSAKVATILSVSIPLFFAGIAVAFAFQSGVFNIGAEGQYYFGGLIGAMAGIYLHLPAFIHIPVVILFSMLGGALWALIPAILKVTKNVHEVITTIMFNSIALALVNYLVNGPLSGLGQGKSLEPQTAKIQSTALFGKLNGFFRLLGWNIPDYVYLDYSLIVAVITGFIVWFVLFRMRYGFEIRAIGTSLDVSRYAGMKVKQLQLAAFIISGALSGLIGLQEIFAIRGYYTYGIASGLGFDGIAIALIGKNSPLGVVFAALLFAFLKQAGYGLQFYTSVPNSVIYVITGLMILFIVVINEVVAAYIRTLRKKEAV
ncbi:MAG: ABC transporter permease [Spirochaetes bacterium]|nr:ABC transporter permease [Spirochaetota bacterium]